MLTLLFHQKTINNNKEKSLCEHEMYKWPGLLTEEKKLIKLFNMRVKTAKAEKNYNLLQIDWKRKRNNNLYFLI